MKTKLVIFLTLISISLVWASDEYKGHDIVDKGSIKEISGTLKLESDEWYLESGNNTYQIHQGPSFYRNEIKLDWQSGQYANIKGFIYENHITPVQVLVNGKTFVFRSAEGRPMWAGRGNNCGRYNSSSQGQGHNCAEDCEQDCDEDCSEDCEKHDRQIGKKA